MSNEQRFVCEAIELVGAVVVRDDQPPTQEASAAKGWRIFTRQRR
jgi:hypothetical protein